MGHEGYSGLSTKAKPFGQTTDFSPGGGKHNPKTVSLVKATQHLKKQFSMETYQVYWECKDGVLYHFSTKAESEDGAVKKFKRKHSGMYRAVIATYLIG